MVKVKGEIGMRSIHTNQSAIQKIVTSVPTCKAGTERDFKQPYVR